jgi:hypothetical protein
MDIANHIRALQAADAVAYIGDSDEIPTRPMALATEPRAFPIGQAIGPVLPSVVIINCVNGREYRADVTNLAPMVFVQECAA